MDFGNWIKGIFAQVNPWDNGADFKTFNPEKKKREEETPSVAPIKVQTPQNVMPSTVRPLGNFNFNDNLGANPKRSVPTTNQLPQPPKPNVDQELDRLTKENMDVARKQATQNQGFFGGVSNFFTGNAERRAEQIARTRAVTQYQEKNGWKNDPGVRRYIGATNEVGKKNARRVQTQNDLLDTVLRKSSEIPVLSDFAAMGSGGANLFYKAIGDRQLAKDASDNYSKATLGMSDAEISRLSPDQQKRLRALQTGLTVASPLMGALDIASFGELGAATGALKNAIKGGGKGAIIGAVKQGGKNIGRNAAIAGASAPVISAPVENYINNGNALDFKGYDPSNIPKQSLTAALWSVLLPGASRKPAAEDVNNARTQVTRQISEDARLAAEGARDGKTRIQVKQPRQIEVSDNGEEIGIPVVNNTPERQGRPIRELQGDTPGVNQVSVPTQNERAQQRFNDQTTPSRTIQDVTPTDTGNTGVFTRKEIDAEQAALNDALQNGEIDNEAYRRASEELSTLKAVDDSPEGQKIQVKDVKNIPVADQTVVPTDLPETPGTVRVMDATAPNNSRSEVVAATAPIALPREVQNVLDNPKQFNKRQVAAARNQRKLAKQMAKTQEQTAEALARIESASPAAQSGEGFVPTGEFAKSANGGGYQKVNRQAEMAQAVQETANLSPVDVVRTARENQGETGGFNRRDIRNIAALFETKRLQRGTPEWNEARQILKEDGTIWGQTGALRNYTVRRTASADELISRFESKIYRLAEDPSKINSKLFDQVDEAETNFTASRDAALQAYNRFTESPTQANAKAYHAAQDALDAADRNAKIVEYKVANAALKGNKDVKQVRELEKMAQSADMYQMDAVDSSMLSGTGTFARNFANAGIGSLEEKLFGKIGARIASLTPNARKNEVKVGGGTGLKGLTKNVGNIIDASKARSQAAGANPLEHIKNWATTGNQLGDSLIDTQVTNNVRDHYTQLLKSQGYKGSELKNRASVMARQDPDNVTNQYQQVARVAAGLGSGITRNNKIETVIANTISDKLSGGKPNKYSEGVAKLFTRMTVGFPTAIGRSGVEGVKRFTLGAPTFARALRESDPHARALLVKEGIKQAGSGGLVIPPLFYALGESGAITGAYPSDPAERDRWEREGISENSIKIGNDYYQLPAYLGTAAIPGLFYASLGRNGGDFEAAAADTAKVVPSLLPTDQLSNIQDAINGRTDFGKFMAQTGASAVRAATPAGALLNQIAKSIDPTKNDTSSGTTFENFIDKVVTGIPGASLTLPNKTDSAGNEIQNPDPLSLALGASSTSQERGIQQTGELNKQANALVDNLDTYGAFSDPNLKAVITDADTKKLYDDLVGGKQLTPEDVTKVQKALVKGVSESGTDTAYLEREQYDTNLAALHMKRDLMSADPTTKPSDLDKMDVAIKRGEIYKENEVPYDLISAYQETNQTEWRAMGNPKSEDYDPEMYEKLANIDKLMAAAGVSYKSGNLEKPKYTPKKAGSGRGGKRGSMGTDFGTIKALRGAPTTQQYASIDQQSGRVPVIQVQRPNIVHKITSS